MTEVGLLCVCKWDMGRKMQDARRAGNCMVRQGQGNGASRSRLKRKQQLPNMTRLRSTRDSGKEAASIAKERETDHGRAMTGKKNSTDMDWRKWAGANEQELMDGWEEAQ